MSRVAPIVSCWHRLPSTITPKTWRRGSVSTSSGSAGSRESQQPRAHQHVQPAEELQPARQRRHVPVEVVREPAPHAEQLDAQPQREGALLLRRARQASPAARRGAAAAREPRAARAGRLCGPGPLLAQPTEAGMRRAPPRRVRAAGRRPGAHRRRRSPFHGALAAESSSCGVAAAAGRSTARGDAGGEVLCGVLQLGSLLCPWIAQNEHHLSS